MKYTLILIAAMAAVPLRAAPAEEPRPMGPAEKLAIEKAVLAADDRATAAGQARDADRLMACMAENDNGSVVMNGVVYLTREDVRKTVAGNFRAVAAVEYRWKQRLVTVLSSDTAVVVSDGEAAATSTQGASFTAPLVQTAVWVRRGGEWKILHAHQSSPRR